MSVPLLCRSIFASSGFCSRVRVESFSCSSYHAILYTLSHLSLHLKQHDRFQASTAGQRRAQHARGQRRGQRGLRRPLYGLRCPLENSVTCRNQIHCICTLSPLEYVAQKRIYPQTSDVGEAFRPIVPPALVTAAYGISWLYLGG